MSLTPRQIQEKQFHDAFRGYSHEEVDSFLDAVAEAFNQVYQQNQALQHRLKEMETELTQAKGSEDILKRMLVTAQETADKAVQEARTKGQSIEQQAATRAEEAIAEAEKKAQEIVVAAVAKEREVQDAIEGARRFDREYRTRLRAFIESQLRVLDEGPAPAPRPADLPAKAPAPAQPIQPAQPAPPPAAAAPPAPAATSAPAHSEEASAPVTAPASTPAPAPAPAPMESSAPNVRSAVSEILRRTEAGRQANVPPAVIQSPDEPKEVIRLPQEAPALVAPTAEPASPPKPDPSKEGERTIDELFWGED